MFQEKSFKLGLILCSVFIYKHVSGPGAGPARVSETDFWDKHIYSPQHVYGIWEGFVSIVLRAMHYPWHRCLGSTSEVFAFTRGENFSGPYDLEE